MTPPAPAASTPPSPAGSPTWRLCRPVAVARRATGSLQVGLDEGHAVLLPDAPPDADRLIRAVRRGRSTAELVRLFPELDPDWLGQALCGLEAAGILSRDAAPRSPTVALLGAGPLAESLGGLLASEGVDLLVVEPRLPATPDALRSRAERWRSIARRHRGSTSAELVEPWRAEAADPNLTVVCPATVEPDRGLTDALARSGRPHLVVRCEPGRAVVGPFVVPGRTPCVACCDRERLRRDPDWALILAQLCHAPSGASVLLRQWAAATGAAQALAWIAGRLPDTLGATLELADGSLELQARAWLRDRSCACAQRPPASSTPRTSAP